MSKKHSLFFLMVLGTVSLLVSCATTREQLVIYTWEEMIPPEVISDFEKANPGVKVVLKTFEENEEMIDELMRTNGSEYDLVIADDYIVEFITRSDWALAQKLDKEKIPNLVNVDPVFIHQFYDPDDQYTVPYGAGVQTIVYNPLLVPIPIKDYSDLWDSSLENKVGIIGNYRVINGMALKVLGKSYNTIEIADINNAGLRLLELAPNIHSIKDFGLEEDLISGTISAAVMYTDQVMKSKLADPALQVVFPGEGIGFGIMPAFIPVKAPNPNAAHRFLNFILDPVNGARCFEYLGYYCTYEASKAHIKPELREYLIMPDFKNFEMIQNLTQEAEDEQERIWSEFIQAVSGF